MSITLQREATVAVLPDPGPGYPVRRVGREAVGRTASGTLFAYEKGAPSYEVELRLESLTDAEKTALAELFAATRGPMLPFSYTDTRGTTRTARFVSPRLELTKLCANVWDVRLHLELSAMGG